MKILTAELIKSCAKSQDFPATELPEIAFLGRSNVGKSSLLNRLVNRRKLARTSSTPGKTRLIHFFQIVAGKERELTFVDLPGYGWAKVSRKERKSWGNMVETYLEERKELCLAVLLQDLRRDFSEDETLLLQWLAEREIPSLVVLTKIDKLKPMRRKARIRKLKEEIGDHTDRVLASSSEAGLGMNEVWRAILDASE